jgi:hypothetical protein
MNSLHWLRHIKRSPYVSRNPCDLKQLGPTISWRDFFVRLMPRECVVNFALKTERSSFHSHLGFSQVADGFAEKTETV